MLGRFCRLLLVTVSVTLLVTARAAAEPDPEQRNAARELAREGDRLMGQGDCESAIDRFERAYALVPAPTIALLEARCLVKLNRLVAASEKYEQIKRMPLGKRPSKAFKRAVRDAERDLDELRPRVPRLRVDLSGEGKGAAEVFLDGEPVPPALIGVERPIDPGEHVLQASVEGGKAVRRKVSVEVGGSETVVLELPAPTKHRSKPAPVADAAVESEPPWGWVALGVGGLGVIAGTVTGLMALDHQNTLDEVCTPRCPQSYADELDSYRRLRTVSVIGFGVGAVGLGLGAWLLLSGDDDAAKESVGLWLGAREAGVRGSF